MTVGSKGYLEIDLELDIWWQTAEHIWVYFCRNNEPLLSSEIGGLLSPCETILIPPIVTARPGPVLFGMKALNEDGSCVVPTTWCSLGDVFPSVVSMDQEPAPDSVYSFNSRSGHVIPAPGDYTPSMVGVFPIKNSVLEEILK